MNCLPPLVVLRAASALPATGFKCKEWIIKHGVPRCHCGNAIRRFARDVESVGFNPTDVIYGESYGSQNVYFRGPRFEEALRAFESGVFPAHETTTTEGFNVQS